jgi:hypothetical protein
MIKMKPMIMLTIVDKEGLAVHPPSPYSKRSELALLVKAINTRPSSLWHNAPVRLAEVLVTEKNYTKKVPR